MLATLWSRTATIHVLPTNLNAQGAVYFLSCVAREVPSYVHFIVLNYDNLPKHMIFAHGHELSWHLKVCRHTNSRHSETPFALNSLP